MYWYAPSVRQPFHSVELTHCLSRWVHCSPHRKCRRYPWWCCHHCSRWGSIICDAVGRRCRTSPHRCNTSKKQNVYILWLFLLILQEVYILVLMIHTYVLILGFNKRTKIAKVYCLGLHHFTNENTICLCRKGIYELMVESSSTTMALIW